MTSDDSVILNDLFFLNIEFKTQQIKNYKNFKICTLNKMQTTFMHSFIKSCSNFFIMILHRLIYANFILICTLHNLHLYKNILCSTA